jgi:hypothetical protein
MRDPETQRAYKYFRIVVWREKEENDDRERTAMR